MEDEELTLEEARDLAAWGDPLPEPFYIDAEGIVRIKSAEEPAPYDEAYTGPVSSEEIAPGVTLTHHAFTPSERFPNKYAYYAWLLEERWAAERETIHEDDGKE